MSRIAKLTLAAALGGCCMIPASWAAGQTVTTAAIHRPAESRTTISEVNYPRGWYSRPRYYGTYFRPYSVYRPYYGYYAGPRVYRNDYGPRVYATPYYGYSYYGFGTPYYGYTYGRPAFRYGVGWY